MDRARDAGGERTAGSDAGSRRGRGERIRVRGVAAAGLAGAPPRPCRSSARALWGGRVRDGTPVGRSHGPRARRDGSAAGRVHRPRLRYGMVVLLGHRSLQIADRVGAADHRGRADPAGPVPLPVRAGARSVLCWRQYWRLPAFHLAAPATALGSRLSLRIPDASSDSSRCATSCSHRRMRSFEWCR